MYFLHEEIASWSSTPFSTEEIPTHSGKYSKNKCVWIEWFNTPFRNINFGNLLTTVDMPFYTCFFLSQNSIICWWFWPSSFVNMALMMMISWSDTCVQGSMPHSGAQLCQISDRSGRECQRHHQERCEPSSRLEIKRLIDHCIHEIDLFIKKTGCWHFLSFVWLKNMEYI